MRRINADIVIALLLLIVCGGLYLDTHFYETVPGGDYRLENLAPGGDVFFWAACPFCI